MLYRGLIRFLSLVARRFDKEIEVVGLEKVPANGGMPVLRREEHGANADNRAP